MTSEPHLTEGELAGYLADDLDLEERRRVEEHLDACDPCRAEAIAVSRLVGSAPTQTGRRDPVSPAAWNPRRGWRLPAGLAGLAAAAGLAGVLLWSGPWVQDVPLQERFGQEGAPQLDTHFPRAGAELPRDSLLFSWSDQGVAAYRLTLSAEDGALLWSQSVSDTLLVPPDTLDLPTGETLYWYVDAIDAGVVARSGARSFTVVP